MGRDVLFQIDIELTCRKRVAWKIRDARSRPVTSLCSKRTLALLQPGADQVRIRGLHVEDQKPPVAPRVDDDVYSRAAGKAGGSRSAAGCGSNGCVTAARSRSRGRTCCAGYIHDAAESSGSGARWRDDASNVEGCLNSTDFGFVRTNDVNLVGIGNT